MNVRITAVDLFRSDCRTRVPFRFGAVTLRDAVTCTARVTIESDVGTSEGFASDLAVPKWFEKDPAKSVAEDVANLIASSQRAAATLRASGEDTVFGHWWRMYRELVDGCEWNAPDRLVRGYGTALVERALIDATCRALGKSFFAALKCDDLGFDPGLLHPELASYSLADHLPDAPAQNVLLRHTVGMLDPLRVADIEPDNRLEDGLPQALEEDIREYGLRCFKIKIGSGVEPDFARLCAIADVLREDVGAGATFTLDGNEQYPEFATLAELLHRLRDDERGRYLLDGLLYVEQPLSRVATFDPDSCKDIAQVTDFAPVIIDEADSGLDSLPRARDLGYRGISVKNCKGVFRALANKALCEVWDDGCFQAGEDLTNMGILALNQDLATVAAFGFEHVERNGHHYFRGLDHLPESEVGEALARHGSLYEEFDGGGARLRVRSGKLDLHSLQCEGFGYAGPIDCEAREPIA